MRMCLLLALLATAAAQTPDGTTRGPSSSEPPYLVPADVRGVEIVSVLTVGDSVNDKPGPAGDYPWYRLVGIPDGLGAFIPVVGATLAGYLFGLFLTVV